MTVAYRPGALRFADWLGRVVFGVIFRLTVTGRDQVPRTGPLILAGNHTGFLDGPLVVVHAPRPVRALTKAELYRGLLGSALVLIGQIPVWRGTPDRTALHACLDELAADGTVAIFPEGTRGDGDMRHIQRGVAWLAVRSGAPILPVACVGTAAALPKGTRRIRLRFPVRVAYGEPFSVGVVAAEPSRAELDAVTEQIRRRLAAHLAAAGALEHA